MYAVTHSPSLLKNNCPRDVQGHSVVDINPSARQAWEENVMRDACQAKLNKTSRAFVRLPIIGFVQISATGNEQFKEAESSVGTSRVPPINWLLTVHRDQIAWKSQLPWAARHLPYRVILASPQPVIISPAEVLQLVLRDWLTPRDSRTPPRPCCHFYI